MKHYKNALTINIQDELKNNKGKVNPKSPREHQVKANKKMSDFFLHDEKDAGILVLPTGGGKTYTSVYWLLKNIVAKGKKILWLADQGFLLEQAFECFRENILEVDSHRRNDINLRIVSGSDKHSNANQISVSDDILLITSQTAISHWTDKVDTKFKRFIKENAGDGNLFIVYDEAHHTPPFGRRNLLIGGSDGFTGIIEKYPKTKLLGLTATPTYTDKRQRGWLWVIFKDGKIYEVSKKELEDKKILASPIYFQEKTNFNPVLSDSDIDKMTLRHQELPRHIIEEIANNEERNNFIAQHFYNNRKKYGKTIIFLDRWYQCKMVESYINKMTGQETALSIFSYVDGNKDPNYINNRTSNQNEINLERFKNNEIDVLINVKMLTEGVDVPDVKTVFITRETNSSILFTQMVGRALRGEKAGGKKTTANIVLFTDNWNKHIQFASARIGGKEDYEIKERGYRPLELIRIDLLEKLEFEYQKQDYAKSIMDIIPIGWYVVAYADTLEEEDENNNIQEITESFTENVIVLESEQIIFENFINHFFTSHKNTLWEREILDLEHAQNIIETFLKQNDTKPNEAIILKMIQIARHLGQNNTKPEYFTFEQKKDIDLMKHVLHIRKKRYGRDETEDYLELQYSKTDNSFFKVLFPTYEDFYKAYEFEDNVYRKQRKSTTNISQPKQEFVGNRLASKEVRNIVLSRDGHKCLCCGKTTNLQIDHLIAFKEQEPKDDLPDLYQTLCSVCNREKSSNSYNYRITSYDHSKISLEDVLTTRGTEDPECYFTRLINCYYKTRAVQPNSVKAKNSGNAIWTADIKYGIDPNETILKHKNELINIIREKGFKIKDLRINQN